MADVTTIVLALLGSAVVSALVSHFGEQARAREERRQKRLASTYIRVIDFVLLELDWVDSHVRLMARADTEPARLPTQGQAHKLVVQVSAYGSQAMMDDLKAFNLAVHKFVAAVNARDDALADPEHATVEEAQAATFAAVDQVRRTQVRPAGQRLLDRANAELAERREHWWTRHPKDNGDKQELSASR